MSTVDSLREGGRQASGSESHCPYPSAASKRTGIRPPNQRAAKGRTSTGLRRRQAGHSNKDIEYLQRLEDRGGDAENFRISSGQGTGMWSHTARASSDGAQVRARQITGSRRATATRGRVLGRVNITHSWRVSVVGDTPGYRELPEPSFAPPAPQVNRRSFKSMVDTRQVKHTTE